MSSSACSLTLLGYVAIICSILNSSHSLTFLCPALKSNLQWLEVLFLIELILGELCSPSYCLASSYSFRKRAIVQLHDGNPDMKRTPPLQCYIWSCHLVYKVVWTVLQLSQESRKVQSIVVGDEDISCKPYHCPNILLICALTIPHTPISYPIKNYQYQTLYCYQLIPISWLVCSPAESRF